MSEITAAKREGKDDKIATEIIPSRSNSNNKTTRVSPPTTTPQESDSRSTSSGTQKTSTTSRRSNKSKDRSTRPVVLPSSPKKPSFIKQQQKSKQRATRRQKQQQRLLATTQASTTAMFCPVPWMIPSREPEDKSTRSITSTIPPHQEYLSYQSNEPSECCDSETSGIELGEPPQPASPKHCTKQAPTGEASSVQTPPPTTHNKARALTPETQAMTEVEDDSVSSEASSTSRIDLPRPRALLFEESMRKIEQDTLQKQEKRLYSGTFESDASTTKLLSPLRFIVFAIVLALLAIHGGGDRHNHNTLVPKASPQPSIHEPTIPNASSGAAVQHQDPHETSIQASTLEKATSIEQAVPASSMEEQALNQATNETVIANEAMMMEEEAAMIRASVEAAKKEAQTIRDQALQTAQSIQQQAVKEASIRAKIEAQKIKQEALEAIEKEASILKEAARNEAESIKQAALASIQEPPKPIQRFLQQLWNQLINLRKKLSELRETRRQRRKAYKQSLLLQTNHA